MLSLCLQAEWLHQSSVGSCLTLGSTIPKKPNRIRVVFDSAAETHQTGTLDTSVHLDLRPTFKTNRFRNSFILFNALKA
jgi:hypothetical protein